MNRLIAMFFGKPESEKLLTKYLVAQTNHKGESRCTHCGQMRDIINSFCIVQFDNKKEMERYLDYNISKEDRLMVEIYQLITPPTPLKAL